MVGQSVYSGPTICKALGEYLSFLNFAKDPGLIDQTAMILGARTEPRAPTASPKLP